MYIIILWEIAATQTSSKKTEGGFNDSATFIYLLVCVNDGGFLYSAHQHCKRFNSFSSGQKHDRGWTILHPPLSLLFTLSPELHIQLKCISNLFFPGKLHSWWRNYDEFLESRDRYINIIEVVWLFFSPFLLLSPQIWSTTLGDNHS